MKINYVHSTAHLLFPKIVGIILVILFIAILFNELFLRKRKEKINKKGFFAENFDKKKLFGSLGIIVGYILLLEPLGFLPVSIIAMLLLNILFEGSKEKKSLVLSVALSVAFPLVLWFVFGFMLNITLP